MLREKRKVLLISGVAAAILYIVFLLPWSAPFSSPFPFVGSLWESHTLRHSMVWHVERKVVGLHKDDVLLTLGKPESHDFSSSALIYRLHSTDSSYFWRHLIIIF